MTTPHFAQSNIGSHDAYLLDVGALLAQRVADDPSPRERQTTDNFATYLATARTQRGLSRSDLAELVGKSEFDIYAIELGMMLPQQIDYTILRKLSAALGEEIELLALILERDIASIDTAHIEGKDSALSSHRFNVQAEGAEHHFSHRQSWLHGEWIRERQKTVQQFLSIVQNSVRPASIPARLTAVTVVGFLCIILFMPTTQQVGTPSATADGTWVPSQANRAEQNHRLVQSRIVHKGDYQIAYMNPDEYLPAHTALFLVNEEESAAVSFIQRSLPREPLACDAIIGNSYGGCVPI